MNAHVADQPQTSFFAARCQHRVTSFLHS